MEILEDREAEFRPLPSIYSLETSSVCDLRCPMCLRTTEMHRQGRFMALADIREMHERGEFAGTTFVELQQAGEPTLHPDLTGIVRFLHGEVGLLVGLSTHGLRMHHDHVRQALMMLDTLTISVDSVDAEVYHRMRYPAKLRDLILNLRQFFMEWRARCGHKPFVELQLIRSPLITGSGDTEALAALVAAEGWQDACRIRVNRDAFMEMDGRQIQGTMTRPGNGQICQSPFTSVSVNQRLDVVACCMIFEPDRNASTWLGNLHEHSLADIWAGPRVRALREEHRSGRLTGQCAQCYTWSPQQIHGNIVKGLIQIGRSGHVVDSAA